MLSIWFQNLKSSSTWFNPCFPLRRAYLLLYCWVSLPISFHLRSKHLCQLCIDSYILAYLHSSYYSVLTIIHEICMLKVESNCWNLYLPLCCFDAFTLNLLLYELTLMQDFLMLVLKVLFMKSFAICYLFVSNYRSLPWVTSFISYALQ